MKSIIILIILASPIIGFSNDSFIFGKWHMNGAVCTVDGHSKECPVLKDKIEITQSLSSCDNFQINITSLEVEPSRKLYLNSCDSSTANINLFSTGYGFHYYNIEKKYFGAGTDIVISGDTDFLEIYIFSSGGVDNKFSRSSSTYFLSKNPIE